MSYIASGQRNEDGLSIEEDVDSKAGERTFPDVFAHERFVFFVVCVRVFTSVIVKPEPLRRNFAYVLKFSSPRFRSARYALLKLLSRGLFLRD